MKLRGPSGLRSFFVSTADAQCRPGGNLYYGLLLFFRSALTLQVTEVRTPAMPGLFHFGNSDFADCIFVLPALTFLRYYLLPLIVRTEKRAFQLNHHQEPKAEEIINVATNIQSHIDNDDCSRDVPAGRFALRRSDSDRHRFERNWSHH